MIIAVSLLILLICSWAFIGLFRLYAIKKELLDHPNHRSSHVVPTPRGGGIVFIFLWLVLIAVCYWLELVTSSQLLVLVPGAVLVSAMGFLDDHGGIAARWRFLAQCVAALISLIALGGFWTLNLGFWSLPLGWFGSVIALIAILWSTNLYNFMDGIDGIAAVEALFVFGIGGYFIWQAGGCAFAMLIWAVAIIVAGFLWWNRPPAKIFMGDVGSALLGFLVVIFALAGEVWYKVPALLWVIVYSLFWFDATVTLIRRILHRETWYQAHRLHSYQRMQLKNWSHGRILCGVVAVNALLSLLAVLAYSWQRYILIFLLLALLLLTLIYMAVERIQPMYKKL